MRYPPTRHASRLAQGGLPPISLFLPVLTMGSPLRRRVEGRDNFEFDESRAGIDEGFVLPRFRRGLTWEPAEHLTGVAELQTLVLLPNDEGFVPSRFRRGLTWEPAEHLTGVVELQTLVRCQLRSRGGNAARSS